MTQNSRWIAKYNGVLNFIATNHRIEEHFMLNRLKTSRKTLNAGELKPELVEVFKQLLELGKKYKHMNQSLMILKMICTTYLRNSYGW